MKRAPVNVTEAGLRVVREMLPGGRSSVQPNSFAAELGALSIDNVFGGVWARDGLDRRSRSLVTLGILIALGAEDELRLHFEIAETNGLTRAELAEVVLHTSGYAGFPAANKARRIGSELFDSAENFSASLVASSVSDQPTVPRA